MHITVNLWLLISVHSFNPGLELILINVNGELTFSLKLPIPGCYFHSGDYNGNCQLPIDIITGYRKSPLGAFRSHSEKLASADCRI
jgi:hypothetical protein